MLSPSILGETLGVFVVAGGVAILVLRTKVQATISKRYKRVAEQNKKERMPTPFESGTVPGTTFITIVATLLVLVGIAFFAAAV